jgi:hypothetical protein
MAAITWAQVTALAPELASLEGSDAEAFIIDYVNENISGTAFGGESSAATRIARIYLAAHLGTMALAEGEAVAGPVLSESVGGASVTYANLTSGTSFQGSVYADMYNGMLKRHCRGPVLI